MRVARTIVLGAGLTCAGIARAAPPEVQTSTESAAPEPEPEPEPEPTTAGEWYARGYNLASAKQFEAAAEAFLRSYELKPTSEALFNAALALENGGDTLASIETYERVLLEPSIDPKLVDQAQRSIEALARTVATIKDIRYSPSRPPVTISIRGEPHELGDFPLRVLPGTIEVEAVDEAGERVTETYNLYAGETLILDLRGLLPPRTEPNPDLGPPAPIVIRDEPEPVDVEGLTRRAATLRRVTWTGLGLTGAGVLATASLGIIAAVERSRYNRDTCLEHPDGKCPEDHTIGKPEAHLLRGQELQQAAIIVGGVTGGVALATLIVGVLSVRDQRRAETAAKTKAETARVRVAPAAGGLRLEF